MKMKSVFAGLFVLGLILLVQVSGAQDRSAAIESLLKEEMARQKIPGMSAVVAREGKILNEAHIGLANLELETPVNEHTAFLIASMSKIYTSAAVHLLAEKGKLDLDESIRKYLPDAPESWQKIKLQHLINHQSGLVDDWTLHDDWENTEKSIMALATTNRDFLKALYAQPLLFEPGTDLRYQAGTYILGLVIEDVSGMSYPKFMKKEVFDPMGLKETWVEDPVGLIPHRASGYLLEDGKLVNGHRLARVTLKRGDVGIRTSARDIAKFLVGLKKKGKLLEDPSKMNVLGRQADGGVTTRTNGGWFISYLRGSATSEHGGLYRAGFTSTMFEFVDEGLTVVLLANRADASTFSIVLKLASLFNPIFKPIRQQEFERKPAPDPKYAAALTAISENRIDPKVMSSAFPITYYRHLSKGYGNNSDLEVLGSFSMSGKRRMVFGQLLNEIVFVRFDKNKYTGIYLDPEGKIIFVELFETP
ncbi:MAG: beta-lactamase family protein [Acidobacteriota bacterium]|nr:MAG: beta-lactamase family protein [Acidobacteriota bacterium]